MWTRLTFISTGTGLVMLFLLKTHTFTNTGPQSIFQVQQSPPSESSFALFVKETTHTHSNIHRLFCSENTVTPLESALSLCCYTNAHTNRYIHTHSHTVCLCSFHCSLCLPCPLIKAICSPGPSHEKSVLFGALFSV